MAKATTSRTRRKARAWGANTEAAYRHASEVAGARFAPRWVRRQAEIFVEVLERKTVPYDDKEVDRAVWFFHGLPVPIGNFGTEDNKIRLAPAQLWWVAMLYGMRDPDDPRCRRFTEMYLVVPRKAGKSTIGAAMCLKELCDPRRNGPLAQCAGRIKETAWHVYDRAKKMVHSSEELRAAYALSASDRQIRRTDGSGARMVCESGNLTDGHSPVIATFDELHDTENSHPLQVLRSSFAATSDPMLAKFTTAGDLPLCLGLDERETAIQGFKGAVSLPNHLNLLYEWDDELGKELDDGDPRLWEAIHPMYHHTVERNFYPQFHQKSLINPTDKAEFNHKLLCKWVRGDQRSVITEEEWDALPESPPLHSVRLARAWAGVDASEVDDLTSLTLLGELEDGRLCAWWEVLAPEGKVGMVRDERGDAKVMVPQALSKWYEAGWIKGCGHNRISFPEVAGRLASWIRKHPVEVVMVDQFSGNDQIFHALPDGMKGKMVRFRKNQVTYTPPTKELLGRVEDRAISVERNPVVRWAVTNAVMDRHISGSLLPKKVSEKSPHKIDPLDSLIQSMAAKLYTEGGHVKAPRNAPIQIRNLGYGGRPFVL